MTDYNDKNKQIRAKNLFEEETSEKSGSQDMAADSTVEGIRSDVMGEMSYQSAASESAAGKNIPGQGALGAGQAGQTAEGKNDVKKSVGSEKGSKAFRGKDTSGKSRKGKKEGKTVRQSTAKGTNTGKKSPRQRQQTHRLYACAVMAVFVVFVMGWGICQLIRTINEGETQKTMIPQPGEQVLDNSANAGKTIDVDEMVNQVLDRVTFEAELNLLEDSVASGMIDTAEGTDLRIYMGNGTHSDELVVMTALNEKDAQQNQKSAENHLAEMQKQFSDYIPKEAKKIDSAIKVRCGSYVVLCVTNDTETAKKTIDAFLKNKE